MELVVIVKAPL